VTCGKEVNDVNARELAKVDNWITLTISIEIL